MFYNSNSNLKQIISLLNNYNVINENNEQYNLLLTNQNYKIKKLIIIIIYQWLFIYLWWMLDKNRF